MISHQFIQVSKFISESHHNILNYKLYDKGISKEELNSLIEMFKNIEKKILEERENFRSIFSVKCLNEGISEKSIWLGGDVDLIEEGGDQPCLIIEPSLSVTPKANFYDIDNPTKAIHEKIEQVFENFLFPLVDNENIIMVSDPDKKIIAGGYDNCIAVIKEGKIFGLVNYGYDKNYTNGSLWLTAFCSNPLDFTFD